jgi:hypothetical protein
VMRSDSYSSRSYGVRGSSLYNPCGIRFPFCKHDLPVPSIRARRLRARAIRTAQSIEKRGVAWAASGLRTRPYRIVCEDGQGLGLLPRGVRTEECVLEGALFSRLLRREADERLSPSLQGSAIHAFLPSRSAPGSGRVGRRSPRHSLLGSLNLLCLR